MRISKTGRSGELAFKYAAGHHSHWADKTADTGPPSQEVVQAMLQVSETELTTPGFRVDARISPRLAPSIWVLLLFGFTVFISAFLLFQVQLLFTKYILPWFGGTPAVFTTCMLFFQVVLLLGYGYAHVLTSRLGQRTQATVHILVMMLAVVLLIGQLFRWGTPLTPDSGWKPSDSADPLLRILVLLVVGIALPYFAVSTTGPVVQAWFLRLCGRSPYRWYALSNAGSLMALLTYPSLVEPSLTLRMQAKIWSAGFVLFAASSVAIALISGRFYAADVRELHPAQPAEESPTPSWSQKMFWLLLAACGSLVLLATTNQICQDIAVVPLLWVLPLSLYLLSFILCFDSERGYSRNLWSIVVGVGALLVCVALYQPELRLVWQIAIYSVAQFACCMVCHGELVRLKPRAEHLTSFYLTIAGGGAIGGLFVSVIAPFVFKGYWEFHAGMWLSCAALCAVLLRDSKSWVYFPKPLLLAFSALVVFFGPIAAGMKSRPSQLLLAFLVTLGLVVFILWGGRQGSERARVQAARFSVYFAVLLLGAVLAFPILVNLRNLLSLSRNFYGVLAVYETDVNNPEARSRWLRHGKIVHGFQYRAASKRRVPTGYYDLNSGIALILTKHPARLTGERLRLGVVGLGVGTLAAYGQPGDYIRFYEINPEVVRLSQSVPHGLFTFLPDTRAQVDVILGDARVSMERELAHDRAQRFDVLAIDAFSGDAIPVHLLTEEAFNVYLKHLKPSGILAFHISNEVLDLSPVIAQLAEHFGRSAWRMDARDSIWVMVVPPGVQSVETMTPLRANFQFPEWTDDYSNLITVVKW